MITDLAKIGKTLRCRESHPTVQKYIKLSDLAEELGISLAFESGCCIVYDRDRDHNLPPILLEDIEGNDRRIHTFPYEFEYKMVYDNPEYLEAIRKDGEERNRKRQEELARKAAEEASKQAAQAKKKAEELELKERAILAELKRKYGT